ncbi:PucR family transcriptional regulator [Thermomonospora amylolytica]|uniref:PucR family transcriptional regulator n=1 Tax=Thermomonospora amylolytica TaxID=1411117 RepID=UPI000E6C4CAD|nr:helix-turn-helix domain-containing protein [Thermomonospora amylolytica]
MAAAYTSKEHLVIQTAVRGLYDRLPQLTDRLVEEMRRGQDPPPGDDRSFWKSTYLGLHAVLDAVASRGGRRPDLNFARRMGRGYAERRIPLDTALRAYRLAGSVLWDGMVDVIRSRHPDDLPVLVISARRTWQMIDELSVAVSESYRQTERRLRDADGEQGYRMLDLLLDGRGDAETARRAAAALDLPPHGRYAVVAVPAAGVRAGDGLLPEEAEGLRFVWRARGDARYGVVHLGPAGLDAVERALRPPPARDAGISLVVESLTGLARARRLAAIALRTCAGAGPRISRLDRHLPEALVAVQPELAGHLRDAVLGPVLALEPAERDVLLRTVRVWLDCAGSTTAAAERLYCHRNTVLNRLRRVEQLTGRRLADPRQAVELALAVEAVRLGSVGAAAQAAQEAPQR